MPEGGDSLTSVDSSSSDSNNTGIQPQANPVIVTYTLNETIDISGAKITNQQGTDASGNVITQTKFDTTDLSGEDVTINENLVGIVEKYYDDEANSLSHTNLVLNQIRDYAQKIQCSDFQGKGTVEDYTALFQSAAKIANDTKQIKFDVDLEGFNEFGAAADELSKLFNSFIVKLENVSIIDDLAFLQTIASALSKIWNLSEVFGRFKQTILATATVKIPKSSHDAATLVQSVMNEVNCAMGFINHFVDSSVPAPPSANLSDIEKNIISKAVSTIDSWSVLCDQGVSIAMQNNQDVINIKAAGNTLKTHTGVLTSKTNLLKTKLAAFNIFPN